MKLVFVTQRIDPADPVLGATVAKVNALAERVDEVVVLTDEAVPDALRDNVRVRLFRSPWKAGRGLRFEAALARELRPRPRAVIAHMCPIYAVLAAPLARPFGIRVAVWFTHWHATPTLRAAERVSNHMLSVDRRSFPIQSRKLHAIGHGIDVHDFACADGRAEAPFTALALGRYSPAKGLETILRAAALVPEIRLVVRGTTNTAEEEAHRRQLEALVGPNVDLGGPVPRPEVPALFAATDVLVNNMRAGATDKVVFEAAASCVPVLVSNPPFDELLGDLEPPLRFAREDAEELAERLRTLAALAPAARGRLGRTLRQRVVERHSVESWADGVLRVLA